MTWTTVRAWTLATSTVYRKAVKTNNDVDGWHRLLNRKGFLRDKTSNTKKHVNTH